MRPRTVRRVLLLPLVALAAATAVTATGGAAPGPAAGGAGRAVPANYAEDLALLRSLSVRNTNHDTSPYRDVPQKDLRQEDHYGPRTDYLNNPAGNPEQDFPVTGVGSFRTACEFAGLMYDDPKVFPRRPGASHLHVTFGNTDLNAFSTYDTLVNSGSGTCNGQELNRTGYWVPAMLDGRGNVRIPERAVVYYKGYGLGNKRAEVYPEGAFMLVKQDINQISYNAGGAQGDFSYKCSDQYSGEDNPKANLIPENCVGGSRGPGTRVVLEMSVKFPMCWNGKDPGDPANFHIPRVGGWFYAECQGEATLPHIEYFVNYVVEPGETTAGWHLSSDVDPTTFRRTVPGGTTHHADWWGGWHPETNKTFVDNCVRLQLTTEPGGCGFGYLSNGGPDGNNPRPGPTLKYRPQYTGPNKVSLQTVFSELCVTDRPYTQPDDAAYCNPQAPAAPSGAAPAGHHD